MPLLSLVMFKVEILEVGVPPFWLEIDTVSWLSFSSLAVELGDLSLLPPTASLKRLYSPLRPFCISSPASPFVSTPEEDIGGDANSLKVVRLSDWDAEVWIASRAWDSCSLST